MHSYASGLLHLGTKLMSFQKHTKEIYETTRFNIQKDLWELIYPKHFVNTLLIHHQGFNRKNEILYMAIIMRHGLASSLLKDSCIDNPSALLDKWEYYLTTLNESEKSLKPTETIVISDIFKPFKNNADTKIIPRFILIEGAPGMGKTTLCKEIAYQWSKKNLLKDSEFLFIIYLRDIDPAVSRRIKHLKDLVHYMYSFDDGATELSEQCGKILNERESGDITIIFDGYDEFDHSSDSLISKILSRKVLPKCRIIVTSRPSASYRLHRIADVRIEVLGFNDESKIEYIEQELKNKPNKIKKLQSYLKNNPSLNSLCYMPMMLTILLYVFKENEELPNNLTELYSNFVALMISHHLQKQEKSQKTFVSLQELPPEYNNLVCRLSELAFLTLCNNQKVFSMEDIKKLCPNLTLTSTDLESLGIINLVKYFSSDKGKIDVFTFLHLSIHEYLAAYYVSSINQDLQLRYLESTFLNQMYQETWNMFTAMNHNSWLLFQDYSIYCCNKYHQDLSNWISDVKSLSFLKCFMEFYNIINAKSKSSNVDVVQFLFCNRNVKINQKHIYLSFCSRESGYQIEIKLFVIDEASKVLHWFKLFQMMSVIAKFSLVFSVDQLIILDRANEQQIFYCFQRKILITQICLANCHISKGIIDAMNFPILQGFQIVDCTFEHSVLLKLASYLSNIFTLSAIAIQNKKLSADQVSVLFSNVLSIKNIKLLDLSSNDLHNDIIKMATALKLTKTLEVLNLTKNNIPHNAAAAIATIISSNTLLREFRIGENKLRSSIILILENLCKISSLQILELNDNEIPEDAGEAISSVILSNRKLERLVLDNNNIGKGLLHVAKALQKLDSLQVLGLSNNDMPKEVSNELALAIERNQSLKILQINDNNLESSSNNILEALCKLSSLHSLELQSNQLYPDTGQCLSFVISKNVQLNQLLLHNNNIGKGMFHIAKALQQLNTVQILNLSNTNMPKETCHDLALAIKCNQCLHTFKLCNNNLHSSVSIILKALSKLSSLKELDLKATQISEDTGEYLSDIILNNADLVCLNLNNNNIGKGMFQIAKALQQLGSLETLALGNTNMPREIFDDLALAIECNPCLNNLQLNDNNLQSSAINILLQALSKISTLKVLSLQSNQLSEYAGEYISAVILKNDGLCELNLNYNNIGKGVFHIAKVLQKCTSLTNLGLGNNNFPAEVCHELSLAIQSNQNLVSLGLFCNNLKLNVLQSMTKVSNLKCLSLQNTQLFQQTGLWLSSIILQNTGLIHLDLSDNHLGDGALHVIKAIQCLTQLKILNLSNIKLTLSKKISEDCGKALLCGLMNNTNLENVNLSNNNIGTIAIQVAKGLQHISSLKLLNLSNCNLPKEICEELVHVITSNIHVEELLLSNNYDWCSSTTIIFLQALSKISTLKVLYLQSDQLTEETGEYLASILFNNPNLKQIILNDNNIGKGMFKIAKALQQLGSLETLALGNTNMPNGICDDLALAIESNPCLNNLQLNDNNLQSSSITILLQALSKISTLKVLDLQSNQLNEHAGAYISSVILKNDGLCKLELDLNNIGKGILYIAKALQKCTSLTFLGLGNNNFPAEVCHELSLAIQSNKNLVSLGLFCNNLKLNVLQSMTKVSNLKVLSLQNTQLFQQTGLWLSSIILQNTGLIYLDLSDNHLGDGALHIIKAIQCLTQLETLNLSNINLTLSKKISEDCGKALLCGLMKNTNLKNVNLSNNNIGTIAIQVAKGLQHISSLKFLNLSNCNLPKEICDELAYVITSNIHVEELLLSNNYDWCSSTTITFLQALSKISTLKVLDLQGNQLTEETGEHLASILFNNSNLQQINLNDNNIDKGMFHIGKALQQLGSLETLALGNTNMPNELCYDLALAIECNPCLNNLHLNDNNLQSSVINIILRALSKVSTLKVLNLQSNQLEENIADCLSTVLLNNTRLEQLLLYDNNIGKGTLHIAKALQQLNSLKVLTLGNTSISKEVSNELALAIKQNHCFESLCLINCDLRTSVIIILDALTKITSLKELNVQGNHMNEEVGKFIASAIYHNSGLRHLRISYNNINKGMICIVKALQQSLNLQELYLSNTNIPLELCNELAKAIKCNEHLEGLYLDGNNFRNSVIFILLSMYFFPSNIKTFDFFGTTISEMACICLAAIIKNNNKLEWLSINLPMESLRIINALQNLSTLKTLVFDSASISNVTEVQLASVIIKNKSLRFLSLSNVNLSQHIIPQAIAAISNLTQLCLEEALLLEEISEDLALAISRNASLEKLIISDNMLQNGLIKVANECNKLNNIKVLQLAHNCIIPSKAVELTSIITQNTSLEGVLLGGITLNAAECFHFNINAVLNKREMTTCNTTDSVISDHCTFLEVVYLEMLRKQIDNDKKCFSNHPLCLNAKNFVFVQKLWRYFQCRDDINQLRTCAFQQIVALDAKKMISSLHILEKVKSIDLENNNVDEDASLELATALYSNNVLEQLWLRGNKLNTAGALYILNSLKYLTTLQALDLSYNNIGSESADGIAAVIDNNPLMNQLWLDGNDLYSTGTIVICNALKKIRTLSILSLCNNGITDDAADELFAVITHNVLLEDLLFSNNQLQYTGITIIAESLNKLIKLRKLDLFNNNISRQGATSLAVVLQNSTCLQDLFLSGNNLETSGALEICNALSHINSLHVLTLSNNNISDEVTSQLIEVLNNNHLYALLIGGNGLECGALKIAQVIENDNIAMQLLDFSNNNISEQDKEKIKVVFSKRENFQFYM